MPTYLDDLAQAEHRQHVVHNRAMAGKLLQISSGLLLQFDQDGNAIVPDWARGDVEKFLLAYTEPRSAEHAYVDPGAVPPDYADPPAARAVEKDALVDPARPRAGFRRVVVPGDPAGVHQQDRIGGDLQYLRDDAKE